jgi:predicted dehydrogenase
MGGINVTRYNLPKDESAVCITIGLIGCGRWGSHILRDLLTLRCSVYVADKSPEQLQKAKKAGASEVFQAVSLLPAVDAIVIATPSSQHAKCIDEIIDRRVPVFVEKPMTTSSASAQKFVDMNTSQIFVMEKWRYHPAVQTLALIARSNELGEVLGLSSQRLQWGNPHKDVDGTWILTPHDLSIANEILGFIPEPVHVLADCTNGTIEGLYAHFDGPPWLRINISTRSSQRLRRVELHCKKGIALFDGSAENQVEILRPEPTDTLDKCSNREVRDLPNVMPLFAELKDFVAYVQGGTPPKSDAKAGYDVVRKIEQMRTLAGFPS